MIINLKSIFTKLFEFSLIILLFQQVLFPSELTFITVLFNIIFGIILIIINNKVKLNPFLISYILFLLIIFAQIVIGYSVYNFKYKFILYLMQTISTICIYNYLINTKKIEKFLNTYLLVAIVSLLLIICLVGPANIVSSRLGHNGSGSIVSYYIFGNPIFKSSNGTANVCSIALLFCTYFIYSKNKKIYYLPFIFFIICCFLCGSRKGLFMMSFFLIYYFFFMNKKITLKKIIYIFVIPFLFLFLIFKVQFFYNIIGIRVESLFSNLLGNETNKLDGNSYLMRKKMGDLAILWIGRKPFFGSGAGIFVNTIGFGSENNFLQICVDYGLFGLFVYYSYLLSLFRTIFHNRRKTILISMFSLLILMMLFQDFGSVTYSWQQTTMWYSIFWAVVETEEEKLKESEI